MCGSSTWPAASAQHSKQQGRRRSRLQAPHQAVQMTTVTHLPVRRVLCQQQVEIDNMGSYGTSTSTSHNKPTQASQE